MDLCSLKSTLLTCSGQHGELVAKRGLLAAHQQDGVAVLEVVARMARGRACAHIGRGRRRGRRGRCKSRHRERARDKKMPAVTAVLYMPGSWAAASHPSTAHTCLSPRGNQSHHSPDFPLRLYPPRGHALSPRRSSVVFAHRHHRDTRVSSMTTSRALAVRVETHTRRRVQNVPWMLIRPLCGRLAPSTRRYRTSSQPKRPSPGLSGVLDSRSRNSLPFCAASIIRRVPRQRSRPL